MGVFTRLFSRGSNRGGGLPVRRGDPFRRHTATKEGYTGRRDDLGEPLRLGDDPTPLGGEVLPVDDVQAFLDGQLSLAFDSTNVEAAHYDPHAQELYVTYHSGDRWAYGIPPSAAEDFAHAHSKGTWIWDNVKVRGTIHAHQVPARKVG